MVLCLELSFKKYIGVFEGAEHNGGVHFGQFGGLEVKIGDFNDVMSVRTSPTHVDHISPGHPDLSWATDQWSRNLNFCCKLTFLG